MTSANGGIDHGPHQLSADLIIDQGKKRKHNEVDMDPSKPSEITPTLPRPNLPTFNLTSSTSHIRDSSSAQDDEKGSSQEWETVDNGRAKKKAKKIPQPKSGNYPSIDFSEKSRLAAQIKISDLQSLVLYILTDASSPQFVSVRHRSEIRKVVTLMVPGLEMVDFFPATKKEVAKRDRYGQLSPDEYYPRRLRSEELPGNLAAFAEMFPHIWPVRTPGDDKYAKMHSPLHAMLTAPSEKSKEDKKWSKSKGAAKPAQEPKGWRDNRTPITEFLSTAEELLENDYTLHPAVYNLVEERQALSEHRREHGVSESDGWVDTRVDNWNQGTPPDKEIQSGSLTVGREIYAMDCEMCMTGQQEFSLTRISIVGWDGSVVMDELVKPDKPIIDYVTQYSGITEAMIAPVKTTLKDIQTKLSELLTPRSILIGHSLNSDLTALKITHPFIIDTALIYPHPRGPPLKSALKYLAQKYLNRQIQKGHGTTGPGAGHDSIEDARTCLDLVKQKCEKGKEWGMGDSQGENIFKRVARAGVRYKNQGGSAIPSPLSGKSSAAIDWGEPRKGPGGGATYPIGCQSDEEITKGVIRAVKGDFDGKEIPGGGADFIWARFRELEALKGWWNNNKLLNAEAAAADLVAIEPTAKTDVDIDTDLVRAEQPTNSQEEKPADTGEIPDAKSAEGEAEEMIEASNTLDPEPTTDSKAIVTAIASTALPPPTIDPATPLSTAVANLTKQISEIYAALPPCTAFVVYSGSGDPREMSRLQSMQAQFKREYKIRKWDDLTVKWTDDEEQALRRAVSVARNGVGLIGVK